MIERVQLEPADRIRVVLAGETIVDSTRGFVVREIGLSDRYYVPRDDVRATIGDGAGSGVCPWKGKWRHVDVSIGSTRVANGAWTYYETTPTCDAIRDHVAFYADKVDRIDVS
jgi:uncharacterized protein (DUF427 family)